MDLARLAGLKPAGILVEILNEDGTMARLPQLKEIATKFDMKLISIEDLVAYRMQHDSLIEKIEDFDIDTRFGTFRLRAYNQTTNHQIHLVLTKGSWNKDEEVTVKVTSNSFGNDVLSTLINNPDDKLKRVFEKIDKEEKGAIVFINQEQHSFDLIQHIKNIKDKQKGIETPKVSSMDDKDFGIGAQILHDIDISKVRLMSNSPAARKRVGITGYGIEITDRISY